MVYFKCWEFFRNSRKNIKNLSGLQYTRYLCVHMYPKLWGGHVTSWDNFLYILQILLYVELRYYQQIISKLKVLIIWNRNSVKLLSQVSVNIELELNRNNKFIQRSSKFPEGHLLPSIYKIRLHSREQSQSAKSETTIRQKKIPWIFKCHSIKIKMFACWF